MISRKLLFVILMTVGLFFVFLHHRFIVFNTTMPTLLSAMKGIVFENVQCHTVSNEASPFSVPSFYHENSSSASLPQDFQPRWQPVDTGNLLFVFSAFHDSDDCIVRVIGIGLKTSLKPFCIIRNSPVSQVNDTRPGQVQFLPEDGGKRYSAVFVKCKIATNSTPYSVSIIMPQTQKQRNFLIVNYPQKVRNNFTVCLPIMHTIYNNASEMVEVMELNTILGGQKFLIYNYSIGPDMNSVLNYYVKKGILHVFNWTVPVGAPDIHLSGQLASIHDCYYRNLHTSKYLVYQDLDEIYIPKMHKNWADMMDFLTKEKPNVGSFMFRNAYFLTAWDDDVEGFKQAKAARQYRLHALIKVWRGIGGYGKYNHSKLILIPERVKIVGIHIVFAHAKGYTESLVDRNVARLQHYRWKFPVSKTHVKDDSIRRFSDQLISRARDAWKCINHT